MTDAAAQWRTAIDSAPAWLREFPGRRDPVLPDGFAFDFSPESSAALENAVLERFRPDAGVGGDGEFTDSAVAYVGEALLRVGGGRWVWVGDPPAVVFDPAPALDPVTPLALPARAVRSRTGDVLVRAHAAVLEAGSQQQMLTPGWTPG